MKKEDAVEIKERGLKAVQELSAILVFIRGRCSDEEFQKVKRGVGLSIGRIQTELLDLIYSEHPDLSDLK
jgi:hypothetical protein